MKPYRTPTYVHEVHMQEEPPVLHINVKIHSCLKLQETK